MEVNMQLNAELGLSVRFLMFVKVGYTTASEVG